jgi:hypothetical protein
LKTNTNLAFFVGNLKEIKNRALIKLPEKYPFIREEVDIINNFIE